MKSAESIKVELLERHRNKFVNRKGGWVIGEGVFTHGKNLLKGILGEKSYFYLLVLNATGKETDDKFCQWLEAAFMCLSWPEPRIWCNTIGAYGGSSRATVLASTVAGILGSDSSMYGTGFYPELVDYLEGLQALKSQGLTAEDIVEREVSKTNGKVKMLGFARPIAKGDERVVEMLDLAARLNLQQGAYITLALEIESVLMRCYGESLNIGGYIASFLLDENFNAQQIYNLLSIYVNSGITACFQEEQEKNPGEFLPLHCSDIEYTGPKKRQLPSS